MSALSRLAIVDLRDRLPTRPDRAIGIGTRPARSLTLHYNGPAVRLHDNPDARLDAWIAHFVSIAQLHIDKIWTYRKDGSPIFGDAIMYAYAVLADGTILYLHDDSNERWHCANAGGNRSSIPVHFALGGSQDAYPLQWLAATALCDALIADHGIAGRSRVLGHREWLKFALRNNRLVSVPNSHCPGDPLMQRLRPWRDGIASADVLTTPFTANIRQQPGTEYPVVAQFAPGATFGADALVVGSPVAGDPRWVELVDEQGYVHWSLVENR